MQNKAIAAKNEYMTSPEYESKEAQIAQLNVETKKAIKQKEQAELMAKSIDHAQKSAIAAQIARSNLAEPNDANLVNQLIFDEKVMNKTEQDIQKIVDKKNEERSAKDDLFQQNNTIYQGFLQDYPEYIPVFQQNEYIQHPTNELKRIVKAYRAWHPNNNNNNNNSQGENDNGGFVGDGWNIEEEEESN